MCVWGGCGGYGYFGCVSVCVGGGGKIVPEKWSYEVFKADPKFQISDFARFCFL